MCEEMTAHVRHKLTTVEVRWSTLSVLVAQISEHHFLLSSLLSFLYFSYIYAVCVCVHSGGWVVKTYRMFMYVRFAI